MYTRRRSIIPDGKKVAFFGASSFAEKMLPLLNIKREASCFFDNGEKKWGTLFMGLPVRNPAGLAENPEDYFVIITSVFYDEISDQLDKYGVLHAFYADCANIQFGIKTDTLAFDITYRCSLKCNNCSRATSLIAEDESTEMTLEQINRILSELEEHNVRLKAVRLMGGEPTIHKQYKEICAALVKHKHDFNEELKISVSTNGFSEHTKEIISWTNQNMPEITFVNTSKDASNVVANHNHIFMAPCDDEDVSTYFYDSGCVDASTCGLAVDYSGFYCDSVAATIARIFNMDIGIKSFAEVTQENLKAQYPIVCSKCGALRCLVDSPDNTKTYVSKTWAEAISNYKGSQLTRY